MRRYYFLTITLIVSSVLISLYISQYDTVNIVEFVIVMTSLVIALLAFIISMKTYFSIDSVNTITKMDGNVLENENYCISITSLLNKYDQEDVKGVSRQILNDLIFRFKKRSNCALDFANNLQYFIDIIIFFPFLINKDETISKELTYIIEYIELKYKKLNSISTGNLILIDESIKLIKYVLTYQSYVKDNNFAFNISLLDVRGKMLKNAVTQTVYYNYLGLFFNKKAMRLLGELFSFSNRDYFSIDTLQFIFSNKAQLSNSKIESFLLYLQEAKRAFNKALEYCPNDVMWEGFINYNDARTTLFLHLIDQTFNWESIMDEAIIARTKFNLLLEDLSLNNKLSYLRDAFKYEEYLAKLVKMNILIASKKDISIPNNNVIFHYPNYEGLDNELNQYHIDQFKKLVDYKKAIINYLNNLN